MCSNARAHQAAPTRLRHLLQVLGLQHTRDPHATLVLYVAQARGRCEPRSVTETKAFEAHTLHRPTAPTAAAPLATLATPTATATPRHQQALERGQHCYAEVQDLARQRAVVESSLRGAKPPLAWLGVGLGLGLGLGSGLGLGLRVRGQG